MLACKPVARRRHLTGEGASYDDDSSERRTGRVLAQILTLGLSPDTLYPACDVCGGAAVPGNPILPVGRWVVHQTCQDLELDSLRQPRLDYQALGPGSPTILLIRMRVRLRYAGTGATGQPSLFADPCHVFDLSVRARNALKALRIHTLMELTGKHERELLGANCGRLTLAELKEFLACVGLSLRAEPSPRGLGGKTL